MDVCGVGLWLCELRHLRTTVVIFCEHQCDHEAHFARAEQSSKMCLQCSKNQDLPAYARLSSQKNIEQDFLLEVGTSERAASSYNRDKMYKALLA